MYNKKTGTMRMERREEELGDEEIGCKR